MELPIITKPEASAIKALSLGTATPDQQRQALATIRDKFCNEAGESFVPADQTLTAFNEGRRAVGIGIRRVIAADMTKFPEVEHGR